MSADPDMDTARRFCSRVVRFLSTIAMDPHLYFEHRWEAEIATLESRDDLLRRLDQLVAWLDGAGLSEGQVRRLDDELAADGLPTYSGLRDARGRPPAMK